MNKLSVKIPSIISCEKDLKFLENKKSAKILVVSDSHGAAEILEKIIKDVGCDCDAMIFCGDGIYDIISFIKSALEDKKILENMPPIIACARGNGDAENYDLDIFDENVSEEESIPDQAFFSVNQIVSLKIAGRTVVVTHGHKHNVDFGTDSLQQTAEVMSADMVFYGHTHRIKREDAGATLILNPGSCARPRGGMPPTFAVVSFPGITERYDVDFFEITETLFGGIDFKICQL